MKKIFSILILLPAAAHSHIIHAGSSRQHTTITAALQAATAGDTILVDEGLYREKNLVISKKIVLKGINYPVLDGEHRYEVMSITADSVTADGFRIINSGVSSVEDFGGIKIYGRRNVVIENNILEDTFFGIYCDGVTACTIRNNRLAARNTLEQQSGNGIHCRKSDSLIITGNTITGHRDGIYFEFVTGSVIWRNIAEDNIRYGLHFMFSHDDAYISNVFSRNGAGVAVMYSHGVKMFHNFFLDSRGDAAYGILLKDISNGFISGNRFERSTTGIYMEGVSRLEVSRNTFAANGWAMKIQASCSEVAVCRNNFTGNTFDAATNGTLMLNSFTGNYWDKYEGYDLNKDGVGDCPYRPVSLYSMIAEKNPPAMLLFRSFITSLMDRTEKAIPGITPELLKDEAPAMRRME